MSAYSFLDVSAVIDGPGGNFSLTGENDQEGISIEPVSDQNTMTEGADGNVMHSLSAGSACTATIRLLKTSPLNAKLNELYKYQTSSAAYHGVAPHTGAWIETGEAVMSSTWLPGSPDYRCPACRWRGPAAELEGQAENKCPECGCICGQDQKEKSRERNHRQVDRGNKIPPRRSGEAVQGCQGIASSVSASEVGR